MTIGIAAISGRDRVVVATDRMLTLYDNVEFEPHLSKVFPLARSIVLGYADSAAATLVCVARLVEHFKALSKQPSALPLSVGEVANLYAATYSMAVGERIAQAIEPLGVDLAALMGGKLRKMAEEECWKRIREAETAFGTTEAFVAGVDRDGVPDVVYVRNLTVAPMRIPGFVCIGSGAEVATAELMRRCYSPDTQQGGAILQVFSAKRRAQMARGVGVDTDLFVCGPEPEAVRVLTHVDTGALGKLYDDGEADEAELFATRLSLVEATWPSLPLRRITPPVPPDTPAPEPPATSTGGS